jgi:hypothetical protein
VNKTHHRVGIGCAWCSWKACEICTSLVRKKILKKNYFSSHKLPKQQLISFWSQEILGIKGRLEYVNPKLQEASLQ